jgi:hypothetical protein
MLQIGVSVSSGDCLHLSNNILLEVALHLPNNVRNVRNNYAICYEYLI